MISFLMWMLLGYCSGFVPNDTEITFRMCQAQYEAEYRTVIPTNPYDDFDREYFNYEIKRAIGRR